MSPFWYAVDLGLIGVSYVAAHVAHKHESRADRVATESVKGKVQRVFDYGGCQSYEKLDAIGLRLSDSLALHEGTHQFTLAQLDRTLHDANRAYALLSDAIADAGSSIPQLQTALGDFCRKYSELVLLVCDVAHQTGHPIAPDDGFRNWMRQDLAFSKELTWLIAEPEFLPLARAVRAFFGPDGFVAAHSLKSLVAPGKFESLLQAKLPVEEERPIRIGAGDRLTVARTVHETRAG